MELYICVLQQHTIPKMFIFEDLLITNFLTVMKLHLHRETMPLIFVIQALAAPIMQ